MFGIPAFAHHTLGGFTATAGTRIQAVVPPAPPQRVGLASTRRHYVRIAALSYFSLGTQHTLTLARPLGRTTLSSSAAAAQAVVNITADPGVSMLGPSGLASKVADNAIAANDLICLQLNDGTYHLGKVSSVATLAITLTANVPTGGAAAGAYFWTFGIITDTDPYTGLAHPTLRPTVTARTVYGDNFGGVICSNNPFEPILVDSDNGTAAGVIETIQVMYTDR